MGNASHLFASDLACAHIEALVDLARIGGDDLAFELFRQSHRQIRFARSCGAGDNQDFLLRHDRYFLNSSARTMVVERAIITSQSETSRGTVRKNFWKRGL